MSNQPYDMGQQERDAMLAAVPRARAVYLALTNMDGPNDASLLAVRLQDVQGVLKADIFYLQGFAVIIYDRLQLTPAQLCRAIEKIGITTSQFFSAEVIGECSAREALQYKQSS